MIVDFEMYTPESGRNKGKPVEYVKISAPPPPPPVVDVVFREATEEDKVKYGAQYARFKKAPPAPLGPRPTAKQEAPAASVADPFELEPAPSDAPDTKSERSHFGKSKKG